MTCVMFWLVKPPQRASSPPFVIIVPTQHQLPHFSIVNDELDVVLSFVASWNENYDITCSTSVPAASHAFSCVLVRDILVFFYLESFWQLWQVALALTLWWHIDQRQHLATRNRKRHHGSDQQNFHTNKLLLTKSKNILATTLLLVDLRETN